ncbi:UNVERIFIED_CONTAM: hypothetical protein Sangu_1284800 [Sesamum angustifolium]|uniref:NHL domain-containing protein n=1 Tax=Sesamum angustifolium TaxID=2727405 RepID=A0AAW2NMW1_9LAMI
MAIRKISDTGVVTIAGGKVGRGGGHVDGPSEDAKFSDDFDVVYIGSSCSLLVIDRGNQAIREIQLHEEDCSPQEDSNLHLGIAVLAAACFFGYMLALLQRRISNAFSKHYMIFSSSCDALHIPKFLVYVKEPKAYAKAMPPAPYQKPPPKSVRPPLIPTEEDYDKEEEGLFSSLGRLFVYTGSSIVEIFSGLFSGFRKKPFHHHRQQHHHHPSRHGNAWPVQESFVIPREDEPPQNRHERTYTKKKLPNHDQRNGEDQAIKAKPTLLQRMERRLSTATTAPRAAITTPPTSSEAPPARPSNLLRAAKL